MTAIFTLVAGTDTGIGKTVAAAALAARAAARGHRVVMIKPVQTGVAAGEPGDAGEVRRLTGVDVHELVRLPQALAPESAAFRSGAHIPTVDDLAARTVALGAEADVVLVEGTGGVAVRLDIGGGTLLDLGRALEWHHVDQLAIDVVLVVRAGLGTLNHTELSLRALRDAGLETVGLIIGSWPADPGPAEQANLADLPRLTGKPVLATLPARAGDLPPHDFCSTAPHWFAPDF